METHKKVWVKVNAKVDEKISNIITLLNTVENLFTLDSCEGYEGRAYVNFRYGDYKTICKFLFGKLAPKLIKQYGEDIALSVEIANNLEPIGKISFRKELTNKLYSTLQLEINAHHKLL